MALTFTEVLGKKKLSRSTKMCIYSVTHDGSIVTIDASSIGLNYITYALPVSNTAMSSVADLPRLSGTTSGPFITMADALSSGAITDFLIFGY